MFALVDGALNRSSDDGVEWTMLGKLPPLDIEVRFCMMTCFHVWDAQMHASLRSSSVFRDHDDVRLPGTQFAVFH